MATSFDILAIRKSLGRHIWLAPKPFGPDGWTLDMQEGAAGRFTTEQGLEIAVSARIIITAGPNPDPEYTADASDWWHASMSRNDQVPTYEDLKRLHAAVWGDGWAYQVFAPSSAHVNIHENALHLWGKPDGRKLLPDFGAIGSI